MRLAALLSVEAGSVEQHRTPLTLRDVWHQTLIAIQRQHRGSTWRECWETGKETARCFFFLNIQMLYKLNACYGKVWKKGNGCVSVATVMRTDHSIYEKSKTNWAPCKYRKCHRPAGRSRISESRQYEEFLCSAALQDSASLNGGLVLQHPLQTDSVTTTHQDFTDHLWGARNDPFLYHSIAELSILIVTTNTGTGTANLEKLLICSGFLWGNIFFERSLQWYALHHG